MDRAWVGGLVLLGCSPSVTQVDGSGSADADTTAAQDSSSGASSSDATGTSTSVDTTGTSTSGNDTMSSTESSSTTIEDTTESTGAPVTGCGDGMLDPDEGCDDGNRDDGDACDSDCVPIEVTVWTADHEGRGGQADCAARVVATADGTWVAGKLRDANAEGDGWVGRLDDDGQWQWHVTYNGSGNDDDDATGLAVDAAGHAWVTGRYTHNGEHVWLQRVDADGAEVWSSTWSDGLEGAELSADVALVDGAAWIAVRRFDLDPVLQQWSDAGELVATVPLTPAEGRVLRPFDLGVGGGAVWLFGGTSDPFEGGANPTLLRLGADASVQQTIDVATESAGPSDTISGAVGLDGSLAAISYDAPAGGETPTVRLWDPEGNLQHAWLLEIDGDPRVNAIALTSDGEVVLAGERDDVPWVRLVDVEGEGLWDRLHTPADGHGALEAVSVAPDGDIVVAGCTGLGSASDVWVRRYRP